VTYIFPLHSLPTTDLLLSSSSLCVELVCQSVSQSVVWSAVVGGAVFSFTSVLQVLTFLTPVGSLSSLGF
jgi:hypothetical protein